MIMARFGLIDNGSLRGRVDDIVGFAAVCGRIAVSPGVLGIAEHISSNGTQTASDSGSFQTSAALVPDDSAGRCSQDSSDDRSCLGIGTGGATSEHGGCQDGCQDQGFIP